MWKATTQKSVSPESPSLPEYLWQTKETTLSHASDDNDNTLSRSAISDRTEILSEKIQRMSVFGALYIERLTDLMSVKAEVSKLSNLLSI